MEYRTTILQYKPGKGIPLVERPMKAVKVGENEGILPDEDWSLVGSCASWDPINHNMVIVWTWEKE